MSSARPPQIITVQHHSKTPGVYDHGSRKGEPFLEEEISNFWAVRSPVDVWRVVHEGDTAETVEDFDVISPTVQYTLFGGEPVRVYAQSDIDGLRALLDAIEADIKEQTA